MKGKLLSLLFLVSMLLAGCTAEEPPSQIPENPSESNSASAGTDRQESPGDVEALTFRDETLGVTFTLPDSLRGHAKITTARNDTGTVDSVMVYYVHEPGATENDIHLFTIDLMTAADWEALQAEGGPTGSELARGTDGRVAVYTALQSNPVVEDDPLYDFFQALPSDLATAIESFAFLDTEENV